jgi:hypothetical protein
VPPPPPPARKPQVLQQQPAALARSLSSHRASPTRVITIKRSGSNGNKSRKSVGWEDDEVSWAQGCDLSFANQLV